MGNFEIQRKRIKIVKYAFLICGLAVLAFIFISLPMSAPEPKKQTNNTMDFKSPTDKVENKSYDFSISKSLFEGLSADLLPYKIIAETATKIHDNLYDLESVNAKYSLQNGDLKIKANEGVLNDELKSIILQNNVEIKYNGILINSDKIQFDMLNKSAHSDSKVYVNYKNSSLNADKFDIEDSSDIINLEGNVETFFKMSDF